MENKTIMLNPDGANLVRQILGTCGADSCDSAIAKLRITKVATSLSSFADSDSGQWLKPVFGSLQAYAVTEGIRCLGIREVARYFAGKHHIEAMARKAAGTQEGINNLSVMMGYDAGLVLDVLLPLADGYYRNGGIELDLGEYLTANPNDDGLPFYHRGLVINLSIPPGDAIKMLEEQRQSSLFMNSLKRLNSPVKLPEEYLAALRLTCNQ